MALDAVTKIEVLCHSARRADVLAVLESCGRVHLLEPQQEDEPLGIFAPVSMDTDQLLKRIGSLDNAIEFLQEQALEQNVVAGPAKKPEVGERELLALLGDDDLIDTARRAWLVAQQMAKLEGAEKELVQEKEFLEGWRSFTVPLEELRRSGSYRLLAGTIERDAIAAVHGLADASPLMYVETVNRDRYSEKVIVAIHGEFTREALSALGENGFTQQDFGARRGTIESLIDRVDAELEQVRQRKAARQARAADYAGSLGRLLILRDAAGLLLERLRAAGAALETTHVSIMYAWVRSTDLEGLSERLTSIGEVSVKEIEPSEGEVPPSPMSEKKAVDPYMMLTEMYGSPTRADPDPTPLIAPFYALFFGICVGDAGYGIALALGSLIGWSLVRRRHGNPRLFQLLFQGGLASILVGVFLGGWFGMDYSSLPGFLQAPADLLNRLVPGFIPGEAGQEGFGVSKQFLYLTLALGLVQLTAGIVVNLVKRLRAGQGFPAVVDQSGWLLATAGLFPWLFNHYLLGGTLYDVSGPLDRVFMYMLIAGAALIFIMGGREAKGFGKVGLGAYATYGIVNLLGDVLSYSRLFALALSSAIIAQVINQMAGMVQNQLGIPVVGIVLAGVVVVGGHLFNLAMACLSGFIHTARLQFVEFFGKFYDGTGVPFRPLRYEPRFIHIDRER